ncbi:MAG: hypothetical protein AAB518_03770 [Patescibacteria group bacterium]
MAKTRSDKKSDPFKLDRTRYAENLRKQAKYPSRDHGYEGDHPLRKDHLLTLLTSRLTAFDEALARARGITEGAADDPYYMSDGGGMVLRPEITIRFVVNVVEELAKNQLRRNPRANLGLRNSRS